MDINNILMHKLIFTIAYLKSNNTIINYLYF